MKRLLYILVCFSFITSGLVGEFAFTHDAEPNAVETSDSPSTEGEKSAPKKNTSQPFNVEELGEYSYWDDFFNMMMALGVILLVIAGFSYLLKRVMATRTKQLNETNLIKVIERRALTPKSAVYLLEVAGKGLIIAETPSGIHPIGELPPGTPLTPADNPPSFSDVIQRKLDKQ